MCLIGFALKEGKGEASVKNAMGGRQSRSIPMQEDCVLSGFSAHQDVTNAIEERENYFVE